MRQDGRIELGHDARPLAEALGVDAALDAALEQHLHADADAEHGPAAGEPALDELVAAARAQRLHDGAEGADARHDEAVGLEHERPVGGEPRVGARRRQRLDGGVDVARPVVEDRDERFRAHRAPFVLGIPSTSGSRAFACRNARANALYSASAMWCGSRPASTRTCTVSARVERDRLEGVAHERAREVAADEVVLEAGGLAGVDEVRAPADVDDRLRERLVERDERVAVARDARLVAERLADRLPEHDRDVLDGVVGVDVGVAGRAHREIGQRVLREGREQVVEERHGGVDVAAPGAVQIEVEFDGGFARRAADRRGASGGAGHDRESIEASASRNAVVSASVPAVTRR